MEQGIEQGMEPGLQRDPSAPPMLTRVRNRLALYLDLIRWNRPAGWLVLLWPTLGALWLAAGGWPGWHLLAVFTLGTVLMRSAGCCINDVADREFDRHVKRTAQRPVTTGKISVREALAVGAVLALVSLGLACTLNWQTLACCVPALLVTLIYPFTKRWFAMPQAVLGVAFGFGIPMAYTATQGRLSLEALGLFTGSIILTLGYDTAYAMVDRDDDLKIGIQTSAITLGRWDVPAIITCYALYLLIWLGIAASRVLALGASSGPSAGSAAWPLLGLSLGFAAAAAQAVWHYTLIRHRTRAGCFVAFSQNHWMSLAVFVGIVLGLV